MMAKGRDVSQTEENLLMYEQQRKENLRRKVQEKYDKELDGFRFHPTLHPSQPLFDQYLKAEAGYNCHEKLHNDAKVLKRKRAQDRLDLTKSQ